MEVLRVMQYITVYAKEDKVLVQELAALMARLDHEEQAFVIYERLLGEEGIAKPYRIKLLTKGSELATKVGRMRLADDWSNECLMLKTPPPGSSK